MMAMPSVIDRVHLSHSDRTNTSPVPMAFSSSGLFLTLLPDAFSR